MNLLIYSVFHLLIYLNKELDVFPLQAVGGARGRDVTGRAALCSVPQQQCGTPPLHRVFNVHFL